MDPPRDVVPEGARPGAAEAASVVRFGAFTLDRSTGELTRHGHRVPLQDQPARVLALLIARQGEIVSRDELRRLVWLEGTFVEFDTGLNASISKIRRALGDSALNPRFIETVPKRGYRFLADVHGCLAQIPVEPPTPPVVPVPPRSRAWRDLIGPAVMLMAGVIAIAMYMIPERGSSPVGPDVPIRSDPVSPRRPALGPDLFLVGSYHRSQAFKSSLEAGIEQYRRATSQDPRQAAAYAALADCYSGLGLSDQMRPREAFPQAAAAMSRALALGNRDAHAYATLAAIHLVYDWDWSAAGQEISRAVQLDPSHAQVRFWWTHYLLVTGRLDDPATSGLLGWRAYYLHDFQRARATLKESIVRQPNQVWDWIFLRMTDEQLGLFDEAIDASAHAGAAPAHVAALRAALVSAGPAGYWHVRLADALERAPREYVSPLSIAQIYAQLGETSDALDWLRRAGAERDRSFVYLPYDPTFDRLRQDRRFRALVSTLHLPRRRRLSERFQVNFTAQTR